MPATNGSDDAVHALVRHFLHGSPPGAHPTGSADGARGVALWARLESVLEPVIGRTGYRALLSRGIREAALDHERLAGTWIPATTDSVAGAVEEVLRELDPEERQDAVRRILEALVKNLEHLLGEELTARLLLGESAGTPPPNPDPRTPDIPHG